MSKNASMATKETKEGFILSAIRYKAGCVGGVQQLSEVEKTDLQAQARLLQAAPGCMCLQHRGSLSARAAHCSHCRLQSRSTTPALLPLLCSNHDHKLNSCNCSLYVGAYCI